MWQLKILLLIRGHIKLFKYYFIITDKLQLKLHQLPTQSAPRLLPPGMTNINKVLKFHLCDVMYAFTLTSSEADATLDWALATMSLAAAASRSSTLWTSSARICTEASSLMETEPEDTKNFLVAPSSSYTVTTPGFSTARVGTWLGRIPKAPENEGTSTYWWNNL